MRNLQEEKFKDKFEGDDKDKIEKAAQEALDWLDRNQLAEKDEFEAKQKELEGIVNPIMMKVYQAAGGGGMPEGGMPGAGGDTGGTAGGGSGPTVEDVDIQGPFRRHELLWDDSKKAYREEQFDLSNEESAENRPCWP